MSDPSLIPEGTGEIAKIGASGMGGGLFTMLLGRLFRGQDKASDLILAEVKALQVSVGVLSSQLAVLTSGNSRLEADVIRLEVTVIEQGKELASLKATIAQISEGLLR